MAEISDSEYKTAFARNSLDKKGSDFFTKISLMIQKERELNYSTLIKKKNKAIKTEKMNDFSILFDEPVKIGVLKGHK